MPIIQFPHISVDIQTEGSNNPNYIGKLGIPESTPIKQVAYVLAEGIQQTGIFVGASIDVIAEAVRVQYEETRGISDDEILETLIEEFVTPRWVYGAVKDTLSPNKAEIILKDRFHMRDFLRGTDTKYDPERVARTIFVPSPTYTERIWDFKYDDRDLERMVIMTKPPPKLD